jgi:hypothetical protein
MGFLVIIHQGHKELFDRMNRMNRMNRIRNEK